MTFRIAMFLLAAAFGLPRCTNPHQVHIYGTIMGYSPGQAITWEFQGKQLDLKPGNLIEADGKFETSFAFHDSETGGVFSVLRNGKPFAHFLLERDARGNWMVRDTDNDLFYAVDGAGPFFIRNLMVAGKIMQLDKGDR